MAALEPEQPEPQPEPQPEQKPEQKPQPGQKPEPEPKVETAGQKVLMDVDKFVGGVKTRGAKNEMVDKLLKAAEAEPDVKAATLKAADELPATGM